MATRKMLSNFGHERIPLGREFLELEIDVFGVSQRDGLP